MTIAVTAMDGALLLLLLLLVTGASGAATDEPACTWWDDGHVGDATTADEWFHGWLGPRVDAAAAAAGSPLGTALRAACPFSVAFHFADDGDAFVLDFGGRQGPSLEHTQAWAEPEQGECWGNRCNADRVDLVLCPSLLL